MNIFGNISFWGSNFSPRQATDESGISFTEQTEVGEIGTQGKYNAKPFDYGAAHINFKSGDDRDSFLVPLEVLNLVKMHKETLKRLGAEEISITVNIAYQGQCNLELSPAFMKMVSDLGVPLLMTCYEK